MSQSTTSTLAHVSAKAGCSPATVSRVLNNSGPVSRDVRRNVLKAVQESGYVPRRPQRSGRNIDTVKMERIDQTQDLFEVILYRNSPMEHISADEGTLRLGPSSKVSSEEMLTQNYSLTADFYMHIISGIMDELADTSRRAMLQTTDDLGSPSLLKSVRNPGIGGVILLGEYSSDLDYFMQQCDKPLVLVDIIHPGHADVVTIDNMAGISMAMDHLLELGHRRIGYIGAPFNKSYEERWVTWQWKMTGAQLPVNPNWVYQGPESIHTTAKGVAEILQATDRPTALVCANDFAAMAVLRAAEYLRINIPSQLSVIGFDDINASAMVTPALTTLHVPLRNMGQQAARQMLISNLFSNSPREVGMTLRLQPQLIVRQSSDKPSSPNCIQQV
jgi:DNA-binding LacI/PurR family transcriptional regulator